MSFHVTDSNPGSYFRHRNVACNRCRCEEMVIWASQVVNGAALAWMVTRSVSEGVVTSCPRLRFGLLRFRWYCFTARQGVRLQYLAATPPGSKSGCN